MEESRLHRILARYVRRHRGPLAAAIADRLAGSLTADPARAEAEAFIDALGEALEIGDPAAISRVMTEAGRRWQSGGAQIEPAAALLRGAARAPVSEAIPPLQMMDSVSLPVVFVTPEGRIRHANGAFRALRLTGGSATDDPTRPGADDPAAPIFTTLIGEESRHRLEPLMRADAPVEAAMELVPVQMIGAPARDLLATVIPYRQNGVMLGWIITLRSMPDGLTIDPTLPQLLAREKTQKEKLEALLTVSQWVTGTLDHQTVLDTIAKEVRRVVQVDECTVFMVDPASRLLEPVACDVMEFRDEVMAVRLKVGEGITGSVALSGRGEIVQDSENDPRAVSVPGTPPEESSLLCVPLIARQNVIGVITLSRIGSQRRPFVLADLELATLFAAQCSSAIHNARIYAQMKSAYDELRATQQQLVLSAKLNALGEMAGGVAHDFNNILAAILGRTQLLMRGPTTPELRRQLEVIEQAALDGAHTVRRVQEFTRVRQDERFETLDINRVLEGVVEFTRPAWFTNAKKRGVTVEMHLELTARQPVAGNASELREVFTNLVLNAVDAMPWGGDLFIHTKDGEGGVRVTFRDTGVGMDEETRTRVFDPFFTTKEIQGTGLGLSVAYGIVTRHHGQIEVQSERGIGTEFIVTLPAGLAPAAKETPALIHRPIAPHTILVVDDEQPVLDVLAEMLHALGQQVHVAIGGEAGITEFDRRVPQIVFSDLGMPEVNGWDVALHIRSQQPRTALVLVTGWGFQLEEEAAMARGVDVILTKPFTLEDVERALSRATDLLARREAA
jgi:signal transduction histidine kinase/CheY-like chemotaxis protein